MMRQQDGIHTKLPNYCNVLYHVKLILIIVFFFVTDTRKTEPARQADIVLSDLKRKKDI